jgi:hypothetical protein
LNKGEIPSTGSLVEVFNKGILERCMKLYSENMTKLHLPQTEQDLQDAHEWSREAAMQVFDEQHFGRHHANKSGVQLDEEIQKVWIGPFSIMNVLHDPFTFLDCSVEWMKRRLYTGYTSGVPKSALRL